ncbi:sigma-70 family RNA polymerase sigma factor [Nonomuraea sp. NPDC049141]|uniref:RNA polymerase sigma factor n=1 Tax=Nonomuraea sp. NPDC049141 TaxID=3155500 RepID=UPI0033F9A723
MVLHDEEFGDFYHTHFRRAVGLFFLLYDDRRDLEEDVQEAFLAMFQKWEDHAATPNPERWKYLVGVIMNKRKDRYRRSRIHQRVLSFLRMRTASAIVHVETEVLANEAVTAMLDLPPQQRLVAILHWIDGLPLAEIAEHLNISPSTARTHLAKARSALTESLGESRLDVAESG